MADQEVDWPSEQIPDSDLLYMRAHKDHIDSSGRLAPGVFRDQGPAMSTDWSKYASPSDTQLRARVPADNGVIQFAAGAARVVGLDVNHTPDIEVNNRAHTDVAGEKTPEVRVKLRRQTIIVIPLGSN